MLRDHVLGLRKPRIVALDACRGWALVGMVLRHAWSWVCQDDAINQQRYSLDWWLSIVCKPSVPLFFMCFGGMIGYLYAHVDSTTVRRKLWGRALQVLVIYKLLYLWEMLIEQQSPLEIWQGLTWQHLGFTVEVLDFYFFMLLLAPWLLAAWRVLRGPARYVVLVLLACATMLGRQTDWPIDVVQALLVGRAPFKTFELVPYTIVFLLGVSIGTDWRQWARAEDGTRQAVLTFVRWGAVMTALFLLIFAGQWDAFDDGLVFYAWKHPQMLAYLTFTSAYAFFCMAFITWRLKAGLSVPTWRQPLALLGRHSLWIFAFHWSANFGLLGSHFHDLSPTQAYAWAAVVLVLCYLSALAQEVVPGYLLKKMEQPAPGT